MSQSVLAVRAGLGEATVRRIETDRHDAREATLAALARVLDVDVEQLVGRAS